MYMYVYVQLYIVAWPHYCNCPALNNISKNCFLSLALSIYVCVLTIQLHPDQMVYSFIFNIQHIFTAEDQHYLQIIVADICGEHLSSFFDTFEFKIPLKNLRTVYKFK